MAGSVHLTAAQAARRLGVSVKALRVLERHGLIRPGRTAADWRVYGPEELARLHQVLALRRLGLRLSEVARLIGGRPADLDRTLAFQEAALERVRADAEHALGLVRSARSRLAAGERLSTDDLVTMIRETTVVTQQTQPSPEMKALIEKHYTPEQLEALKARPFTDEDQARVSAAWADVYAEAERLAANDADPGGAEGLELARRSRALIAEFTGGDPGVSASLQALWRDGTSRPEMARAMPGSPAANGFLARARERLEASEPAR